ncbi:ankyrin repeat domain-containing protein [Streptomyces evansiae]|uniref:ankyrin repeat domain-containing protein n=1 Tax=Streptomyces evansiae TaxID=3075535 RepID=UPI002885EE2A|nr:ankyrin repeat domain-containing protein [Streptomyces sp. DSM 41859]MDT0424533.1 ankyrin repeat domain-containing protein [Streptomyces sp. DSM 41859]
MSGTRSPAAALLLAAARTGDADSVRRALADGADPEVRDEARRTPLLLAAQGDHVAAAQVLVAAGADPDAQDTRLESAWLATGVTGSVAMMRALLPAGPDVRLRNRFGGIALIPASERGHVAYVEAALRETGMDVNHVNRLGWTALLEAVILGDGGAAHEEIVRLLLAAGARPDLADGEGVTAREHAERRGFAGMAALLAAAASGAPAGTGGPAEAGRSGDGAAG